MQYSLEQQAKMFRTTVEKIRAQHLANAWANRKAAEKAAAAKTGKYSGRTYAQWIDAAEKSEAIANS